MRLLTFQEGPFQNIERESLIFEELKRGGARANNPYGESK